MASVLPSPEPIPPLSTSLLDLDFDAYPKLTECMSPCSKEMTYNQAPGSRAGQFSAGGAGQQGVPQGQWRPSMEYGRHSFFPTPEMNPIYQTGYNFPPPAPSAPIPPPPPYRQPIAQIQSFAQQPFIPERQLDQCYSYALDRGDGTFTRLVPADRLPPLHGLGQAQDREGLIVLPRPRGISPHSRQVGAPNGRYIVRPSPIGERRPTQSIPDPVMMQSAIDQIVAAHPSNFSPGMPKSKREKTYCDKWLHDGTCAFTQQGCKYLHEMPLDRETQMSVGLFNGLPAWYKRAHSVELKRAPNRRGSSTNGPTWRGRAPPAPLAPMPRGLLPPPPPPAAPQSRGMPSGNPYDVLFKAESDASEGDNRWTRN